jgi:hypothetical protein
MRWVTAPSGQWRLMDRDRLIAEVQQDNGTFPWQRYTTLAEHGVVPAAGREDSKKEAMRQAARGLKVEAHT